MLAVQDKRLMILIIMHYRHAGHIYNAQEYIGNIIRSSRQITSNMRWSLWAIRQEARGLI